jgi:hypothetical protein
MRPDEDTLMNRPVSEQSTDKAEHARLHRPPRNARFNNGDVSDGMPRYLPWLLLASLLCGGGFIAICATLIH